MTIRHIMVFGLAMLLALIAVLAARNWLTQNSQTVIVQKELPTKDVVVAVTPLYFGNMVRREHLKVIKWPAGHVPLGTFDSIENLLGDGSEERYTLKAIAINEPLFTSKVSGFGERVSLSTMISDGMRATTIRVNDVKGVAGFIMPGDRVDVLLTRPSGKDKKDFINDILLQNVKVLGIDQNSSEERDEPSVVRAVTLETTPRQSQKLTLAEQTGNLSLALRKITNTGATEARTIRVSDLKYSELNNPLAVKKKTHRIIRRRSASTISVKVVRGVESQRYTVLKEKKIRLATDNKVGLKVMPQTKRPLGSLDSSSPITSKTKPVTEFDVIGKSPPKNLLPD
ncbi:MAG: Flp pilus assembly protein CpaB [Emcibacter sp.]|nr:Flp pilus assembly protein CpaB [Emcibacter sp.]